MPDLIELLKRHDGGKAIDFAELERGAREQLYDVANPGFCVACGAEGDGCEPDAVGYRCEECGLMTKCGASELFMVLA